MQHELFITSCSGGALSTVLRIMRTQYTPRCLSSAVAHLLYMRWRLLWTQRMACCCMLGEASLYEHRMPWCQCHCCEATHSCRKVRGH